MDDVFDWLDVGVWLCERWIFIVEMLDFGCTDVGFMLYGR